MAFIVLGIEMIIRFSLFIAVFLALSFSDPIGTVAQSELAYPPTPRGDTVEEIFGHDIADPYRWLEDGRATEVVAWSNQQDAVSRAYLDALPGREVLTKRLTELLDLPWDGTPHERGERWFYERQTKGLDKPILYWRNDKDEPEKVLVDPNALSTANRNVTLGRWGVTRDGTKIAYALKANNADEGVAEVMDVETGRISEIDRINEIKHSRFKWVLDGSGFYYTHLPIEADVSETERPGRAVVRFHKLGTPQSEDALIFGPTNDPATFVRPQVSWNGRWLFVYVWYGWRGVDVYLQDLQEPNSELEPFYSDRDSQIWISELNGYFYIQSNKDAPNKKLYRVSAGNHDQNTWEVLIEESDRAVMSRVWTFGGRLLVQYEENVHHRLEIREPDGTFVQEVALPDKGVTSWIKGNPDQERVYVSFQSLTIPWKAYELSMSNGELTLWNETAVPVDPSPYQTEQIWFSSADGTRVPMFVVGRKDLPRDGSTPFWLYGYGGFNNSQLPKFFPTIYPWLEAGGGFAMVNLRGGGEFGKDWHRAGMRRNKQNTFDDFIAAAETLVAQGFTKPKHLAINGRSNGGLLVASVMTQRPELFGAVLCGVPLTDMLRYTQLGVGKTWIEEYGTPEDPEDFSVLQSYSPYHQVKAAAAYPPILISTADTDDRVDPAHARKFAAILQQVQPANRTVLLSIERQAGHGGSDLIAPKVKARVDRYAFIMNLFGMRPARGSP